LRKEFTVKKEISKAQVNIIGLGLYELYFNGAKIDDHVLAPTPTDYNKSVKYNTFDVTANIAQGKNAIGVILGTGHYYNNRQHTKPEKHKIFGYPKLLLELVITFTDGTTQSIVSDQSWKITTDGAIRSTNDYDGEIYDATKEFIGWNKAGFKDGKWLKPEIVAAPTGEIALQQNPNMKVMQTLKPQSIKPSFKDTLIIDMGQNMTGWLQFTARGTRGTKISLRFAETLQADGHLKTVNLRSAYQNDIYTMKSADAETWEPRFVTHGFRYVEVTATPAMPEFLDFTGKVVYDEMETTGTFESSNKILDQIIKNAWWGISGNYKGMPLDCPQRDERQPWLGDHAVGSLGESFLFDNHALYEKWLDDIRDSQTPEGKLSDIAPPYYMTYYSDNMTWSSAYFMVADMLWKQYGDAKPIARHYPYMKKWLDYMKRYITADYIVPKDKYGDWCVPPEKPELIHSEDPARKTDGTLIATAYYYKLLNMMIEFAPLAGQRDDIKEYAALAQNIKNGFNKHFYNAQKGFYGNNTVTSNILPLAFGMVASENENRVFQNVLDRISADRLHISTGVIGTQWLMRELTKRGRADIAYTIATQKTYPSWGYMAESGATTIWELWNGDTANPRMNSHNHVMLLGDLLAWVFEDVAGIKSHPNQKGFRWLWMKPHPAENLTFVKASHKTPYGLVKSEWKLENGIFVWKITIPPTSRANILVPAASVEDITVNGVKPLDNKGLKYVRIQEEHVNLEIGEGDYTIVCKYGEAQNRWKAGIVVDEFINLNAPYPESHAATVAENKNGEIVASWFGGTKERNPDVCIWVSIFRNGRWTEPQNVANGIAADKRYPTWNPVLYQEPDGDLQLYYKVGPSPSAWWGKVITSKDGGNSWSAPVDLPEGILGAIKNKPVLWKNQTLVAPTSTEGNGWKIHFELYNYKTKKWQKTANLQGENIQAIQPTILTHPNGKLQMLSRTQSRQMGESWSADGGKTWSPITLSSLPNNNSGLDGVTLRDGRQLVVYNHVIVADSLPRGKGARTPLNVAVSDDGKTWYAACILEDSPIGQYSYPSVIQDDKGLVHIVYTWRRKAIKRIVIDPAKLILSKIENGEFIPAVETDEVKIVNTRRYKVSVCDWMMLKRQKIGAIDLAGEFGADGVEIDLGGLGSNVSWQNNLLDKKTRDTFIERCNQLGVQFSSLALSAMYSQSFARRENIDDLMDTAIETMKAIGVKVCFLPMGVTSDIVKEPELYPIVVERLKKMAKKAEAAGVIIGVETALPAKDEVKFLDAIGSPAVKSYVNLSRLIDRKANIVSELKTLGKDRIAQIHASNTDGFLIENDPALNMPAIKQTLDQMGWNGWLVIERSRDTKDVHNVKRNYGANVKYLQEVFRK
jgi:alpha-L-rhamnosidase